MTEEKSKSTSLLYLRLAEQTKTWQWVSGILICIIVMQAFALALVFPLKEVRYRYVEFNSSQDVYYKMLPSAELSPDQKYTLARKALRKYVYDRNLKDDLTEKLRAKSIRVMSNKKVWEDFKKHFSIMLENMEGVRRNVEIISDSPIGDGIHQIEFRTEDERGTEIKVREYVATLGFEVNPQMVVSSEDDYLNPLGIVIKTYNVSERRIKEGLQDE